MARRRAEQAARKLFAWNVAAGCALVAVAVWVLDQLIHAITGWPR
jgi:preprotein translocase subunit SecE